MPESKILTKDDIANARDRERDLWQDEIETLLDSHEELRAALDSEKAFNGVTMALLNACREQLRVRDTRSEKPAYKQRCLVWYDFDWSADDWIGDDWRYLNGATIWMHCPPGLSPEVKP